MTTLNVLAGECHDWAKQKGFWDSTRNDGEMIALMHSELSELLEALRMGDPPDQHCPEFPSSHIEAADLLIRLLDYCGARSVDLDAAVDAKMAYNYTRPYKHGKKF